MTTPGRLISLDGFKGGFRRFRFGAETRIRSDSRNALNVTQGSPWFPNRDRVLPARPLQPGVAEHLRCMRTGGYPHRARSPAVFTLGKIQQPGYVIVVQLRAVAHVSWLH